MKLGGGELPHKSWLDKITTEIPIYLMRTDGHMAIVNSKVLALAGITKDTPNPEGGVIEKMLLASLPELLKTKPYL